MMFVCFILHIGTVASNHYHGCLKCSVIGKYCNNSKRMSYPHFDIPRRTDTGFRMREDPDHHKCRSPLEDLPIDMIQDFPIADSLHLFDLGLTKKCLLIWMKGSAGYKDRFTKDDIIVINYRLKICNETIPCELHRAVRNLNYIKVWKALEFRNFLLYFGFVVLKDVLPQEAYEHFLLLFATARILSCKQYTEQFIHVAATFIDAYLEGYIQIYGINSISSNVHNLCHVIDDVRRFGPLTNFSTYPFENALYQVKQLLRNGNQPLSQVAKRVAEFASYDAIKDKSKNKFPIVDEKRKKIIINENFTLSNNKRDKYFLTVDKKIVAMEKIVNIDGSFYVIGQNFRNATDFFNKKPFNSSYLDIFVCDRSFHTSATYHVSNIKSKLISIAYKDQLVFIPLLHTI